MILKNETQDNFVIVSQSIMHDRSLKCFDRGLLITLISLPDNWDFTIKGLTRILNDGRDAIAGGLKRLQDRGYLVREQLRENGQFGDICLRINMTPALSETGEQYPDAKESNKSVAEIPLSEGSMAEESIAKETLPEEPLTEKPLPEKPLTEIPSTGKPSTGIPTQYKNNKSNNHRSNIQGSNNKICHISAGKEAANGTVRRKQDHNHGTSDGKWTQDEIDLYGL